LKHLHKHIEYQMILETKHKTYQVSKDILIQYIKYIEYQTILETKHKTYQISNDILTQHIKHIEYQTILEIKLVTRTGYIITIREPLPSSLTFTKQSYLKPC